MRHRVMCIPVRRIHPHKCQVLVVTNRGGSWVFPRGKRRISESPVKCAQREAREEAGVSGKKFHALGLLLPYDESPLPGLQVDSFIMHVNRTYSVYQDQHFRQRQWVNLQDLPRVVQRSYCHDIITGVLTCLSVPSRHESCSEAGYDNKKRRRHRVTTLKPISR